MEGRIEAIRQELDPNAAGTVQEGRVNDMTAEIRNLDFRTVRQTRNNLRELSRTVVEHRIALRSMRDREADTARQQQFDRISTALVNLQNEIDRRRDTNDFRTAGDVALEAVETPMQVWNRFEIGGVKVGRVAGTALGVLGVTTVINWIWNRKGFKKAGANGGAATDMTAEEQRTTRRSRFIGSLLTATGLTALTTFGASFFTRNRRERANTGPQNAPGLTEGPNNFNATNNRRTLAVANTETVRIGTDEYNIPSGATEMAARNIPGTRLRIERRAGTLTITLNSAAPAITPAPEVTMVIGGKNYVLREGAAAPATGPREQSETRPDRNLSFRAGGPDVTRVLAGMTLADTDTVVIRNTNTGAPLLSSRTGGAFGANQTFELDGKTFTVNRGTGNSLSVNAPAGVSVGQGFTVEITRAGGRREVSYSSFERAPGGPTLSIAGAPPNGWINYPNPPRLDLAGIIGAEVRLGNNVIPIGGRAELANPDPALSGVVLTIDRPAGPGRQLNLSLSTIPDELRNRPLSWPLWVDGRRYMINVPATR
jgi:hypothetical protein